MSDTTPVPPAASGGESTTVTTTDTTTTSTPTATAQSSEGGKSAVESLTPDASFHSFFDAVGKDADGAADAAAQAAANTATANTDTANTATAGADEDFESDREKSKWEKRKDKYAQEARTAYDAELFGENGTYRWAKDVPKEAGELAIGMLRDVQRDPIGSMTDLIDAMAKDPQRYVELQSWALDLLGLDASVLTGGKPTANAAELYVQTEDGKKVFTEQAVTQLLERQKAEILAELQKETAPFKRQQQERQEHQRQVDAAEAENKAYLKAAADASKFLHTLPGFEDHKQAIIADVVKAGATSKNIKEALYEAYARIAGPKAKEAAASDYIKSVTRKAGVSTVSPSSGVAADAFDPAKASWAEAFAYVDRQGQK